MKLHRLVLTNYRGITHRELDFPDRGVVVVSGANEIGKSSMIEALDLLLSAKDRSSKKDVKQVKPTHADVGAEVTAEISTGPYRFVYHKRFHRRPETQLTMLAPRREQLSGDEAHERVLALLDETVDMELWRTQRVLQSGSTAPVDLSGSDALSRALDVAAGATADDTSGAEPLLIDRIEAEFRRYFTATGRPTGEWAAATKRLQDANEQVGRCAAAVAEVDDAVHRHARLTADLTRLAADRVDAEKELTAARAAADTVDRLTRELAEAQIAADAAQATHTAAVAALTERRRMRADIDERAATIAALEPAAQAAAEEEATAREVCEAADSAAEEARAAAEIVRDRVDAARLRLQRRTDRAEHAKLTDRLGKINTAAAELNDVETDLAAITLTEAALRDIEAAAVTLERAAGQAELASAHIELTAHDGVSVRVGDRDVVLAAGDSWSMSAGAPTDLELPGLLTARIVPGAPASETQAKYEAAQATLTEALRSVGMPDVEAARATNDRRRQLATTRDTLRATLAALTGDDTVESLRDRVAELTDVASGTEDTDSTDSDTAPADVAGARAELATAEAAYRQAVTDSETHRKVAATAAARLADKTTSATTLREKLAAARTELATASERLAAQRATVSDDTLAVTATAEAEQADRTAARVVDLRAELERTEPDRVAGTLTAASQRADTAAAAHLDTANALRELTAQLQVYGTEGRQGALDAAEAEREHAETEFVRVQRLARAVQLLRSTMARHRDASRRRYVDPFRTEVERLGRLVFGDSFEVDIDSDLSIRSRTVAGRTVDYESLSGGAKEQLGIVARLAGATLVSQDDTVPVVIDDALGFTDAERLVKMGAVFDAVGGDGQVIVLTCDPDRYAGVTAAHRIELTA